MTDLDPAAVQLGSRGRPIEVPSRFPGEGLRGGTKHIARNADT